MNGQTQLVGILGWPVAHSKSPAMHNAAFKHLGLNWSYVPLPVQPQHALSHALKGICTTGFRGANVTVPYKEEALTLVDESSKEAQAIGAVNTIVCQTDGKLRGENTDARGFLAHLNEEGVSAKGMTATVIGAGGAARAVIYALLCAGVEHVMVINRNRARADLLVHNSRVESFDWSRDSFKRAAQTELVINTTSLGLKESDKLPWDENVAFASSQIIYDAIYSKTPFLNRAIADGARAISGEGMLLWQGALAFELWTGLKAPIEVMRRELQNA